MQHDKGAVDFLGGQALQQVIASIDAECIHTGSQQRLQHGVAGLQRDLTLGALAAEQHSHTPEGADRKL